MKTTHYNRRRLLTGASAALVGAAAAACGGGGGGSAGSTASTPMTPVTPVSPTPTPYVPAAGLLRDTYRNDFKVGAAIQAAQIIADGDQIAIVRSQHNSVTAEYEMKADQIAPTEGVYDFTAADRIVDFAIANGMEVRGHALLWHKTTPDYFLTGTKAQMKAKLESYVTAVMTHFKGRVKTWDVVNEVITDNANDSTAPYRNSNWYQAVGSAEFIDWAFNAARAADPDAKLHINEYGTELAGKLGRFMTVLDDLLDRNIPVDGVGHQAHLNLNTPAADMFTAIDTVDGRFAGLENHITELDISVYSDPGSCFNTQTGCAVGYTGDLPAAQDRAMAQLYRDLMTGFAARASITSVTLWGIDDGSSWLNDFPVTRRNFPLLFDRDLAAKRSFRAITDSTYVI